MYVSGVNVVLAFEVMFVDGVDWELVVWFSLLKVGEVGLDWELVVDGVGWQLTIITVLVSIILIKKLYK